MKKNYSLNHLKLRAISLSAGIMLVSGFINGQTTYSFTNAGATGNTGPSQGQVNTAYLATNLNGSVTIVTTGIQRFVIPSNGIYEIEAWGGGNTNCTGAKLKGTFNLIAGDVLNIAVGHQANPSGGHGGSFVSIGPTLNTSTALIVAGGGGGNHDGTFKSINNNATYSTSGNPGTTGFGGAPMMGGQTNTNNTSYGGGGGGGFTGNGVNTSNYGIVGSSFINGAMGGPLGGNANTLGAFGGGGSGYTNIEPAGGGGYAGGGGGGYEGQSNTGQGSNRFGGGGGSYNSGIVQTTLGINNVGYGRVFVTSLCSPGAAPTNTTQVANQNICINNTTTLTVTGTGTLNWYATPSSTVVLGTGSVYVTPTLAVGNYTYYAASTNTCAEGSRTPITVTVNPLPTIAIAGGTAAVCAGTPINLTASGADTYSWNTGAVTSTIAPTPTANATYTVIGTSSVTGCSANSVKSVTVTPAPSLSVTGAATICAGVQSATLSVSGANTYSWSTGSTSANIVVTPTATATYTANGTSSVTGCSAMITVVVTVDPCTGLNNIQGLNNSLSVYPNPNSGEFIIELNNGLNKTVEISDVTGRIILSNTSTKDKINVNINSLSNGIYYVKIQSEKTMNIIKVIKQ